MHLCLNKKCHWFSVKADNPTSPATEEEMNPAEMRLALRAAEAEREQMRNEMEQLR